ncbi:ribosome small subunit-dependent GTPase A [Nakamurella antarctica]|uniref:Small ribosomal subunit biogenesis GTPase RsgA n=1 Tax=Nakamurella antarctica TaxID=1902245 RepID=A0A3G8ZQ29_9ACTN|nr:ribosome small subunit-dependent GTPase A [Nakamurella antarctica]
MKSLGDRWDNDDVRVRPGRSSRPRTKTRPDHNDAVDGFVITVDRGRYTCLVDEGRKSQRLVTAMRARELGRRGVAVGDVVNIVGDASGNSDTLARIVRIADRTSVLRRSADDTDTAERILVANADQLVIVCALVDPVPRTGFIDRCLVAAYAGHLDPVLVLTKADLADPAELIAAYADVKLSIQFTAKHDDVIEGIEDLRKLLQHKVSVLVGHSGVGKSTLVNALVPDADRAVGGLSGVGKGRHTSTSALALQLPTGGWVVDTPGVRSFGLAHVTADDLLVAFEDLLQATTRCPPGCGHGESESCALDAFVASGGATDARLTSFRRLLSSLAGVETDF